MSRLTEKEIDLIQSARAARRHEPAGEDPFIQKARALQSEATAEMAGRVAQATGLSGVAGWLTDVVFSPAAEAMQRRRTIQQLKRLDDHLLRDIGLERGMIESFGEELSARTVVAHRAVAKDSQGPIAFCQNWLQRRRTINELESLSDHELSDIGVVRGQIEEVVDRAMHAKQAGRRARRRVSAAAVEALTYEALKVNPPLRPRTTRPVEAAPMPYNSARVLPMWLGPWLPARHRDAA